MTLKNNDSDSFGAQSPRGEAAPEPTGGTTAQAPAAAEGRPDGRPAVAPDAGGCDPDVLIDEEFKSLIPPHTAEERSLLREKLSREGCRDPLVLWKGRRVVLDGMVRLEICRELGIPYPTASIDLPSREAAKDWVIAAQLGRRNLTRLAAGYLRGQRYNVLKGPHGGPRKRGKSSGQSDHSKTAVALAAQYGTSASTIQRDGQLAEAIDRIGAVLGEEVKRKVLSGGYAMTQDEVIGLAELGPAAMKEAVRRREEGGTARKAKGPAAKAGKKAPAGGTRSAGAVPAEAAAPAGGVTGDAAPEEGGHTPAPGAAQDESVALTMPPQVEAHGAGVPDDPAGPCEAPAAARSVGPEVTLPEDSAEIVRVLLEKRGREQAREVCELLAAELGLLLSEPPAGSAALQARGRRKKGEA